MAGTDGSTGAPAPDEVTFDTVSIGCIVLIFMFYGGFLAIAAFDSAFFAELADSPGPA